MKTRHTVWTVLRRTLATLVAVVVTTGVGALTGARSSWASACERAVVVSPQISASEADGTLVFGVYSAGCAAAGSVSYRVTVGTAAPGSDYVLTGGEVEWRQGDADTRLIVARLADDAVAEATVETFSVTLVDPSPGVVLVVATGVGRILDDDTPGMSWVVDDNSCWSLGLSATASGGSAPSASFSPADPAPTTDLLGSRPVCDLGHGAIYIDVDGPHLAATTITLSTVDGTAHAGVDYVAVVDEMVTVPAGATHGVLRLQLSRCPDGTPNRWFYVQITALSSGTVVDAVGVVTIEGW